MLVARRLLLFAALASSVVLAQGVRCVPRSVCAAPIEFAPTPAQYVAAFGAALGPSAPTDPVTLHVQREGQGHYAVEVSRSPWGPSSSMRLEARVTLSGPHAPPRVLDWMPVGRAPSVLVQGQGTRTDVAIEYRLWVTGTEAPGSYTTTLTYALQAQGAHGHERSRTVTNTVRVTIPAYVLLRLDGVPVGRRASVSFDYAGANAAAYVKAIEAGASLPLTSATFDRLQVLTNNPAGYRVRVSVTRDAGPAGSSLGVDDVLLFGRPADGATLTGPSSATIVVPSDFSLRAPGSAMAGAYTFTVTYRASASP